MNASRGYDPAYKFTTNGGNDHIALWTEDDPGYDPDNLYRNARAYYFLPNEDEWYKAAYYDPAANGGGGRYWTYGTGSDSVPTVVGSGTLPGTAVYYDQGGPADITIAGGSSAYGTMGQCGNVEDWCESAFDPPNDSVTEKRLTRGGAFFHPLGLLESTRRNKFGAKGAACSIGFRVASIAVGDWGNSGLGLLSPVRVGGFRYNQTTGVAGLELSGTPETTYRVTKAADSGFSSRINVVLTWASVGGGRGSRGDHGCHRAGHRPVQPGGEGFGNVFPGGAALACFTGICRLLPPAAVSRVSLFHGDWSDI